jgi:hypothetical protein
LFFSLAIKLLEKETLSLPDIVDTLGQRPFPLKASVLEYLEELREREAVEEAEVVDKAEGTVSESEPEEGEGKEEDTSEKADISEQKDDKK